MNTALDAAQQAVRTAIETARAIPDQSAQEASQAWDAVLRLKATSSAAFTAHMTVTKVRS